MSTSSLPSFIKIHLVVLEKKSKMWKVYGRTTTTTTDGRTDAGRCAMTIAHSSLRLRWAKKSKVTTQQNATIWDADLNSLLRFTEHANNIHENIKIELRWSRSCIEFLDTSVKLENGHIYTDLYSKPTDKHLYLKRKFLPSAHTKSL